MRSTTVIVVAAALAATACTGGDVGGEGDPAGFHLQVVDVDACTEETRVVHVATGDLDRDGIHDLVVACRPPDGAYTGRIEVHRALGDGAYEHTGTHDLTAGSLAVGDVDGDGAPDVAVGVQGAHERALVVLRGDGDAGLTGETAETVITGTIGGLVVHDLDGDGAMDVLSSGQWFRNEGGPGELGPFADAGPAGTTGPDAIGITDVDGDGRPDATVHEPEPGVLRLHLADGSNGRDLAVGEPATEVDVLAGGDFDGDGVLDLVVARMLDPYDSEVLLLVSDDGGWHPTEPVEGLTGRRADLLGGDLDGDGETDLLSVPEADPEVEGHPLPFLAGRGDGSFEPPVTVEFDAFPYRPILTDATGGGVGDVAVIRMDGDDSDLVVLLGTS